MQLGMHLRSTREEPAIRRQVGSEKGNKMKKYEKANRLRQTPGGPTMGGPLVYLCADGLWDAMCLAGFEKEVDECSNNY